MAPRKLRVTIDAEGRDLGKVFQIEEMPALQAEAWAYRALLALANNGAEIPDDLACAGMAAIAAFGLKALTKLRYHDAEPLLAEMLDCVQICPDPRNPQVIRPLVPSDIEEVATLVRLRVETFNLHVNFSQPAALSTSQTTETSPAGSENTSTSPAHVRRSSARAKHHTENSTNI